MGEEPSFSASVAGTSGADVSAGASEAASVGATLANPGLRRGLGLILSLGPGRSETGLTPPGLRPILLEGIGVVSTTSPDAEL